MIFVRVSCPSRAVAASWIRHRLQRRSSGEYAVHLPRAKFLANQSAAVNGVLVIPLFMSIQRVLIIFQPLACAIFLGILVQTFMSCTYFISLSLASMT